MQHELVTEPIGHRDGWMYPPVSNLGLGVDVIDGVVLRYRM